MAELRQSSPRKVDREKARDKKAKRDTSYVKYQVDKIEDRVKKTRDSCEAAPKAPQGQNRKQDKECKDDSRKGSKEKKQDSKTSRKERDDGHSRSERCETSTRSESGAKVGQRAESIFTGEASLRSSRPMHADGKDSE